LLDIYWDILKMHGSMKFKFKNTILSFKFQFGKFRVILVVFRHSRKVIFNLVVLN